jgi:hypothetical protein
VVRGASHCLCSATRTLLLTVLFLFLLLILLLLLLMRFVAVDVQVGEQPWFALSEEPAQSGATKNVRWPSNAERRCRRRRRHA